MGVHSDSPWMQVPSVSAMPSMGCKCNQQNVAVLATQSSRYGQDMISDTAATWTKCLVKGFESLSLGGLARAAHTPAKIELHAGVLYKLVTVEEEGEAVHVNIS